MRERLSGGERILAQDKRATVTQAAVSATLRTRVGVSAPCQAWPGDAVYHVKDSEAHIFRMWYPCLPSCLPELTTIYVHMHAMTLSLGVWTFWPTLKSP